MRAAATGAGAVVFVLAAAAWMRYLVGRAMGPPCGRCGHPPHDDPCPDSPSCGCPGEALP